MCSRETTGGTDTTWTRRRFLSQGVSFASLAATTPLFIDRSAKGIALPDGSLVSSRPGVPDDHVLVVVQLSGGNDGLNTVVPYGSADYYRARPRMAIQDPSREGGALQLDADQGLGLHPNLDGFKSLMDEGVASVIQGVGYPNPNRSHFTSMDIWQTGDPSARGTGWIGRYFDNQCSGTPEPLASVAIGGRAPLAMVGDTIQPVAFETPERFRWLGGNLHDDLEDPYHEVSRAGALPGQDDANEQLDFLTRTALDAQVASEQLAQATASRPLVTWPRGPLAGQLRTISAMLRSGLPTRVFYASLGGFDTHANQPGRHAQLMRQVGDALKAFHDELKSQGDSGRVMTMVFSEFGRRVAQNASQGTDHGTAAPMYLVGDMVRPGVLGSHPSLTDLDSGDLKHTVDFRSIYAGVLESWMGCSSRAILGGNWEAARILA